MGKPYKLELEQLDKTYQWAARIEIDSLVRRISELGNKNLLVIGSGGSLSTAQLWADLHQKRTGRLSKSVTPLIATAELMDLKDTSVALVSARGKNRDVLAAADAAIAAETSQILTICGVRNSPLAKRVNNYSGGETFEFEVPCGRDGFLATNSLLALHTIVLRAYGLGVGEDDLPKNFCSLVDQGEIEKKLRHGGAQSLLRCDNLIVLFGPDSKPAAIDLESKLTEAALSAVQLADYRNFGHGRHHWLAKRPNSGVLAFVTPTDHQIAKKTLALLPRRISRVEIATECKGGKAVLALQAAVFFIIAAFGKTQGIDPGRPGVPEFGRKIYHLRGFESPAISTRHAAVARKLRAAPVVASRAVCDELFARYDQVMKLLAVARFSSCVLDYDGTICDHKERFHQPSPDIANHLARLLGQGFWLGIATGRGVSVRRALQGVIPKKLWTQIVIGYYNGAVIGSLDDETQPSADAKPTGALGVAAEAVKAMPSSRYVLTIREHQITVEGKSLIEPEAMWREVAATLEMSGVRGVKILASTRSVDVIVDSTSKLSLMRVLPECARAAEVLFIGDRPRWPGNDYELLAQPYALSVAEVSPEPDRVWNMAPQGYIGSKALAYYLGCIKIHRDYFRLQLDDA